MDLKSYKNYIAFIISTALFLIMSAYIAFVYVNWSKPVNNNNSELEVVLPIINWQSYNNLSKQHENVTMTDDKSS